jgi:FkbM family methyltransferase
MTDLVVGDVISGQIALNGFYEWELSQRIYDQSKTVGLFVDVGANIGYFTLLWLAGNPSNRACAVEASPRNQKILEKNLEKNGFSDRCRLLTAAAGDSEKEVTFDLGPEEQTGWGGILSGIDGTDAVQVQMVRLDACITEKVSVMKIDVEGADTLVIKGCEKLLQDKMIEVIYFEQNPERMRHLEIEAGEAQKFLRRFGYTCRRLGADEWMATVNHEC